MSKPGKTRVLFLCTGNSCRSQMAEGWTRHLLGDAFEPCSAEARGLNPLAVRVMAEAGVDISWQRSKTISELAGVPFELVVTVCHHARESCPILPDAKTTIHAGFDDPPQLAQHVRSEPEALGIYRRVREEIKEFVRGLPRILGQTCKEQGVTRASEIRDAQTVREQVRAGYAKVAQSGSPSGAASRSGCCSGSSCCGPGGGSPADLAHKVGYNEAELATLPDGANMGLSCGNPTALAWLKPGEVVLDLGSGGGFDCFLAGPRVGRTGRVIGVDMTPEMLSKARGNVAAYHERTGLDNVEFRLGEIEHLPLPDSSVDVVISNCVINLSPDKPQVWREITRVLKPGGRVAVSDIALLRPLPEQVRGMVEALVGCIAGAMLVTDTERFAREAGLVEVRLEEKRDYVESMTAFDDPLYQKIAAALPAGMRPADFVTSLNVTGLKPVPHKPVAHTPAPHTPRPECEAE